MTVYQFKHILSLPVLLLFLHSCSFISVNTTEIGKTDFKKIKTYSLAPNNQGKIENLEINKLWLDKLLVNAMHEQLQKSGYIRSDSGPDMIVSYFITAREVTDTYAINNYYLTEFNYKASSTQDNQRIREATYKKGTLLIDIVDASTNERIWQGTAESRLDIAKTNDDREKRVKLAVSKILSQLPATSRKSQ